MIDIQQRRTASLTRPSTVQVTEVDIHLCDSARPNTKFLAYANFVLNGGVAIRSAKIISGKDGRAFISMPSEKREGECPTCSAKNRYGAEYCNHCGGDVSSVVPPLSEDGRREIYRDVCFPINSGVRRVIEDAVMAAYREALANKQEEAGE